MPIYDYVCTTCGHQLEVMHGVHDAGPATCPSCSGALRKALTAPAIHFKGSGWAKKERGGSSASSPAKPSSPESAPASGTTPAPASGGTSESASD